MGRANLNMRTPAGNYRAGVSANPRGTGSSGVAAQPTGTVLLAPPRLPFGHPGRTEARQIPERFALDDREVGTATATFRSLRPHQRSPRPGVPSPRTGRSAARAASPFPRLAAYPGQSAAAARGAPG